jgi:phage gpG-like protein
VIRPIVKYIDKTERVAKAARRAVYRAVEKTAFAIRTTAVGSIQRGAVEPQPSGKKKSRKRARIVPSAPGSPPHTRFGQLKRSIVYAAAKGEAVIGPRGSIVGESATAHEFGGNYKGEDYPGRPFMGPALDSNLTKFGSSFAGSIGA